MFFISGCMCFQGVFLLSLPPPLSRACSCILFFFLLSSFFFYFLFSLALSFSHFLVPFLTPSPVFLCPSLFFRFSLQVSYYGIWNGKGRKGRGVSSVFH